MGWSQCLKVLRARSWGDPQRKCRMCDHHLGVKNANPQLLASNLSLLFLLSIFFFLNNFGCKIADSRNVWAMQLDSIGYYGWWLTLIKTL